MQVTVFDEAIPQTQTSAMHGPMQRRTAGGGDCCVIHVLPQGFAVAAQLDKDLLSVWSELFRGRPSSSSLPPPSARTSAFECK